MASYAFSVALLPPFLAMLFIALLGLYGWRRRKVTGAVSFAVGCLFGVAWSLGLLLGEAATDPGDKIFWLRFATVWQLPLVTAGTCFVLQYAGLGRWLTRPVLVALAVPPLLFATVIATDGLHHLVWTSLSVTNGHVRWVYGPFLEANLAYSYILFAVNLAVLAWLFVRSPRHRAPVALMVLARAGARVTFEVGVVRSAFPSPWNPDLYVLLVTFGVYAIALFGFHVFDPLPTARRAALATMRDGMVVADGDGRIVDVNPAAERALGGAASDLRGRPLGEVPLLDEAAVREKKNDEARVEPVARDMNGGRYLIETTSLEDRRGQSLGRLILLHDVTEQERTQARLLEQERVVATLQERERLARELHDSVGQVLGYVSLQAQTASKRLRDGDAGKTEELLSRLASVAQHAHADVRESILALHTDPSADWLFLPTLRRYLEDFETQYGVATRLEVDGVTDDSFPPRAGVQLLRVIQEAMTNARRHGHAQTISVALERRGDQTHITVADDGEGFDPLALGADGDGHFGLGFMRERMAQIGGDVTIDSTPGAGTWVQLTAPAGRGQEDAG
jgi:PAS domain S-box-containing protein